MSLLVTSPHSPASARLPGANAARREATITAAASRKLFFPPAASHGPKAQKSEKKKMKKKENPRLSARAWRAEEQAGRLGSTSNTAPENVRGTEPGKDS